MFRFTTPTLSLIDTFRELDRQTFSDGFPTDILDLGDAYRIDTELPGFTKEEIKVSLEGKNLTLSANTEEETVAEGVRYLSRQRSAKRSFRKTFIVSNIDKTGIAVKLENGILSVTLPKIKPAEPEVTEFPIA